MTDIDQDTIFVNLAKNLLKSQHELFLNNLHNLKNINHRLSKEYKNIVPDFIEKFIQHTNLLVYTKNYKIMKKLLKKKININNRDVRGNNVLFSLIDRANSYIDLNLYKLLFDYGLDPLMKNYLNKNVLTYFIEKTNFKEEYKENYAYNYIIQLLIENKVPIEHKVFFNTIFINHKSLIKLIFKNCNKNINFIYNDCKSNLLMFAIKNDKDYKFLFNYKIDIHYKNILGNTAIHYAFNNNNNNDNNNRIIDLINRGACLFTKNIIGELPSDMDPIFIIRDELRLLMNEKLLELMNVNMKKLLIKDVIYEIYKYIRF